MLMRCCGTRKDVLPLLQLSRLSSPLLVMAAHKPLRCAADSTACTHVTLHAAHAERALAWAEKGLLRRCSRLSGGAGEAALPPLLPSRLLLPCSLGCESSCR